MNLTKNFFNQKLTTYSKKINTLWNKKQKHSMKKYLRVMWHHYLDPEKTKIILNSHNT